MVGRLVHWLFLALFVSVVWNGHFLLGCLVGQLVHWPFGLICICGVEWPFLAELSGGSAGPLTVWPYLYLWCGVTCWPFLTELARGSAGPSRSGVLRTQK